jgi:triosephosphate isomerase
MRTPLIAGFWKMHKTHLEALMLVQQLGYVLDTLDFDAVEVAVCPPFTSLRTVQTLIGSDKLHFKLGAQNVHHEAKGAFTGEISPGMLQALDVEYVIVGHSERREHFDESNDVVREKIDACFDHELTPIVCVGESESERDAGEAESKVEAQVHSAFKALATDRAKVMVVAYEPIWAIGTGKTATPDDAQGMSAHIRTVIDGTAGSEVAQEVRVQYGGSVKPGNAESLLRQADVDGALVGGASLEAADFAAIVKAGAR